MIGALPVVRGPASAASAGAAALAFLALVSCLAGSAQAGPDDILGVWLTDNKSGWIEIYRDGDTYAGRIVAVVPPNGPDGRPQRDARNADPALRARPLKGVVVLTGLKADGSGAWRGGRIYRPEDGKTYGASVTLKDHDHLVLTASAGIFRGSKTWTRGEPPR